MLKKYLTKEAARFLTASGRKTSHRTLQKYRTKAPGDPGEHGPRWMRDPVSGYSYYLEEDLLAWVKALDERLIAGARTAPPTQLAA